jgi:hypothetical protein
MNRSVRIMVSSQPRTSLRSGAYGEVIDLRERPQHRANEGVSEGLSQVHGLRAFLKQALDRGLYVALDWR